MTDDTTYATSTDTRYVTQMALYITAASRLFDLEVGRWEGFFYPTTDSVDKYYDGNGGCELYVDEFASISAVSVSEQGGLASSDYTAYTSTDYFFAPYNYSVNAKPITKIVVDEHNGSQMRFYGYRKAVKVTGIPGYSTSIPAAIGQACKIQAIRWFMRAKQAYQDTGASVEMGSMKFTTKLQLDPDVKQILWPYKLELDR